MTSKVTIEAHCASNKEVTVVIADAESGSELESFTVQDGEKQERYIYDGRTVTAMERIKAA